MKRHLAASLQKELSLLLFLCKYLDRKQKDFAYKKKNEGNPE